MSSLTHTIGGIFQPLLKGVADVLAWLYSIIPSYPIDVALLTIIIMAILTPLTVKSTKNMAAMQALGPEMKKLQQKYKGAENRAMLNEEMMKLYKEHKVNPASGCLPMLLQMPFFLVLYDVIRGITNTVNKGALLADGKKCIPLPGSQVCADPRYISNTTKMYHDIVAASGQLNSFGLNFADKLLSHHSSLFAAIPYLLLVVGSVGLQYLQMSRLNARNPQAAKANPQAAMMQKYMPLIFGLIYLNVAALLNVYFIVSSSIRIGTQEVLFRKGIVAGPPAKTTVPAKGPSGNKADRTEREIPKARPPSSAKGPNRPGTPRSGSSKTGPAPKAQPKSSTVRARDVAAGGNGRQAGGNGKPGGTNGAKPGTRPPSGQGAASKQNGSTKTNRPNSSGTRSTSSTNGAKTNSAADTPAAQQNDPSSEQPSSKTKRERKAQ
jgi:YidC/Oxa1 family membrane protein insertase